MLHLPRRRACLPSVATQQQEQVLRAKYRLGGAANVALNIKAMGATPYLFSAIGSDTEGSQFLQIMGNNNLSTRGLLQIEDRPTTVKTRIMAGTQQMLRVDSEVTSDLSAYNQRVFMQRLQAFLREIKADVLIFQDYNKGVLSLEMIQNVMQEAQKRQIPTTVDPKHKHFLDYQQATLFKPNLKEIREAVDFEVKPDLKSLERAASFLRSKLGNRLTMITLSEKGLFLSSDTEGSQIYPIQPRQIADVSGAGDTVISVASLCLAAGTDEQTLALLSNLAGSQVCELAGVVPVNKAQLKREFEALNEVLKKF